MYIKKNIWLMYAIALLQGMVFYGPVATLYRQAAGVDIFGITLIESISLALCVLLELPWGLAADRIGYKKTMLICCWIYFLSKIVFWKATGFWGFLAERVMLSVVMAGISGVDVSIVFLSCGQGRFQKVFGIYENLCTVGLMAAAGAYSIWIGSNYRLAGFLTVISYALAALLSLFITEVKSPDKPVESRPGAFSALVKGVVSDRRLLLLLLATALLNETHQTVTVFLNQLQYVRCGMGDRAIGLVYAGVTAAGLLGVFSARVTAKFGELKLGGALFAVSAAMCGLLAITAGAAASVAAILLLRICFSLYQPLHNELQNRMVKTADRATALSVNAVLMDGVAIGSNLIFGGAAKYSLPLAFSIGAVFCAAGFGFYRASQK